MFLCVVMCIMTGGFSAKDIAKNPAMARMFVMAARKMKAVQLREAEEKERARKEQQTGPGAAAAAAGAGAGAVGDDGDGGRQKQQERQDDANII
jgi:hypothetical protein